MLNKYDVELERYLIEEINKDTRIFSWSKFFKVVALESLLK
jgi:hypothetical protein